MSHFNRCSPCHSIPPSPPLTCTYTHTLSLSLSQALRHRSVHIMHRLFPIVEYMVRKGGSTLPLDTYNKPCQDMVRTHLLFKWCGLVAIPSTSFELLLSCFVRFLSLHLSIPFHSSLFCWILFSFLLHHFLFFLFICTPSLRFVTSSINLLRPKWRNVWLSAETIWRAWLDSSLGMWMAKEGPQHCTSTLRYIILCHATCQFSLI